MKETAAVVSLDNDRSNSLGNGWSIQACQLLVASPIEERSAYKSHFPNALFNVPRLVEGLGCFARVKVFWTRYCMA